MNTEREFTQYGIDNLIQKADKELGMPHHEMSRDIADTRKLWNYVNLLKTKHEAKNII